jgi:hypothetical protein
VGKFKLESGKLWLTALAMCSGEVALGDVYPDLESPALASWLTGIFKTQVRYLCSENPVKPRYAVMQVLTVEQGVVTSVSETRNDSSVCDSDTGR